MAKNNGIKAQSYKARFEFLVQVDENRKRLFTLHEPDLLEQNWTVFSKTSKRTVGKGATAALAVDHAMFNSISHLQK
jgi:hypothetical protein